MFPRSAPLIHPHVFAGNTRSAPMCFVGRVLRALRYIDASATKNAKRALRLGRLRFSASHLVSLARSRNAQKHIRASFAPVLVKSEGIRTCSQEPLEARSLDLSQPERDLSTFSGRKNVGTNRRDGLTGSRRSIRPLSAGESGRVPRVCAGTEAALSGEAFADFDDDEIGYAEDGEHADVV